MSIEYEKKLEQVHNSQVLNKCPSNAENITSIRSRMNEKYGLSAAVVDAVMRQLPYAPKPAAIVRNENDKAYGSTYSVYWIKDVSAVFKRFVEECEPSNTRYTHPFICGQKFRLNKQFFTKVVLPSLDNRPYNNYGFTIAFQQALEALETFKTPWVIPRQPQALKIVCRAFKRIEKE